PSVLGYRPYDDALQRNQRLAPFYADEFTVGLMNMLSAGSLSADQPYGQAHDDLLLELFCARNTAGKNGRVDAPTDSLKVLGAYRLPAAIDNVPDDPLLSEAENSDSKVVIVRVSVDEQARDEDNFWRLPATHFRLVAEGGRSYYPLGYLTYWGVNRRGERALGRHQWQLAAPQISEGKLQVARCIVERKFENDVKLLTVDWVYRLPTDEEADYMVFRRLAKSPMKEAAKAPPPIKGALEYRVD
ncbi:MAG: hypothetical protein KAU28_08455, partial [Phycisphaerae bacterium]|nr:hypothetical protein [Phycisphaerae bacterium]